MVRVVGFELTTLCSQSRCANQAALHSDYLVPHGRLELPHLTILEPKSSASTNSANRAIYFMGTSQLNTASQSSLSVKCPYLSILT